MKTESTRRRFLKNGGLLVTVGALSGLAGCSETLDGGGGGGGDTDPLEVVPSAADNLAYADVTGILEDSGIETVMNKVFELAAEQPDYDGPTSFEEATSEFESEANLDPTALEAVVGFSEYGQEDVAATQYGGAWYRASWSEDDVVSAVEEQGMGLSEESYSDHTVYGPESEFGSSWIGVISENEYVIGTEDAVKDAIDVQEGDDDGVGDTLSNAYENARSGLVKAVATVPDDAIPDDGATGGSSIDISQFNSINVSTAVFYADGDELGIDATLRAGSEDDASDINDVLVGARATGEGLVEQYSSALVDVLDEVEISQDGDTVTISYSNTAEDLSDLLETVVDDLQSMSGTPGPAMSLASSIHGRPLRVAIEPLRNA